MVTEFPLSETNLPRPVQAAQGTEKTWVPTALAPLRAFGAQIAKPLAI
jgi:hypothetical protein